MPNGGSDCCGTCWFNRNNDGRPGYHGSDAPAVPHCIIRHIDVPDPFYTYCANHPHKNPGRIEIPLGPVYSGDSFGNREILLPAPDSEEIRAAMLKLLQEIPEQPIDSYPAGYSLEQTVILQLAQWKEPRAVPGLERVAAFPLVPSDPAAVFRRDQQALVALARTAISHIRGEPVEESRVPARGRCLFCSAEVVVAPPTKGHLVECAACRAVLVAGHARVLGGYGPGDRDRFGADLKLPPDPPPCLLPGASEDPTAGPPAALRCPFCKARLLDPCPGVLRKVMCPQCDQWLVPGEVLMAHRVRLGTRRVHKGWIIAAIMGLVGLVIVMIASVFR